MKLDRNVALQAISGIVSIFAGLFILFSSWSFTSTQFTITGLLLILIGVLLAGAQAPSKSWPTVFSLIALGAYSIGRGSGDINHQFLRYASGITLLALGSLIMFLLYVKSFEKAKQNKPKKS